MPVSLMFRCARCEAFKTAPLQRPFVPTGEHQGLPVGKFGEWPSVEEVAPKGWVASDPRTGCCYCPDCWEVICAASPVPAEGT